MSIWLLGAVLAWVAYVWLNRSADKEKEQFVNRPSVILTPSKDLFVNQKYAVVGLLAYVQGASPISVYDEEANRIVQSTIFSLGLSLKEVEKYLKVSMNRNPEILCNRIFDSLSEIRDKKYLAELYKKSMRIARISGNTDCIDFVQDFLRS